MGKKTPLYSGGNNPTVTPHSTPQRAVLPLVRAVLPLSQRYCRSTLAVLPRKGDEPRARTQTGTTVEEGRYYRWEAVLPPLLPHQVPQNPTREKAPRIDAAGAWQASGSTAEGPPAVLPLRSGTTAYDPQAVLPLVPRYCRWVTERAHREGDKLSKEAEGLGG
jgi:hypothetical protein